MSWIDSHSANQLLLMATVVAPGVAFASLGLCWLVDLKLGEKPIGRITAAAYLSASAMLAILFVNMLQAGESAVSVSLGAWFQIDEYSFPLTLLGDRLSIPMMMLTAILIGLIGSFSRRYLHRESGYRRFFSLLNLFGFGSLLIFAAGSFDLLIGGWELVGITSVLLIAFFQERREPVRNAVRVFAIYRAGDIGLLVGVFLLHHFSASASFAHLFIGQWPVQHAGPLTAAQALTVGLLFLVAAAAKAAQFPFSGWLPRAMEGPTPSSAIFYGAMSIHAGCFLLLRVQPLLLASTVATVLMVI
ncbi:MAG: oxidoreductase, partial [Planctomycetales bacterium]|nr:oxidoreductase [Planctomycetales bacterium]